MPFTYRLPVPPLLAEEARGGALLQLTRWLVEEREMVQAGTKIAIIETPSGSYDVLANGPGFFSKKLVAEGSRIAPTDAIGVIAANGEDTPYHLPYARAQRIE